eukprot:587674-Rhodomonas_salina.2
MCGPDAGSGAPQYCTDKYVSSLSWKSLSYYPCSPSWVPPYDIPTAMFLPGAELLRLYVRY